MKALNQALNILIGAAAGVFLGRSAYVVWNFHRHPGLYAVQSAPWYTGILVDGALTLFVLALCLLLKAIVRHHAKKR